MTLQLVQATHTNSTGVTLTSNTGTVVADNVAPVLQSGKVNTDGTLIFGYSEGVTGSAAGDYVVTLNGEKVASSALSLTDITAGSDKGGELV
jgi:hypothetical protein